MQSTEFIDGIVPQAEVEARSFRIIKYRSEEQDVSKSVDYPVYPEHPIDSDWKRNPYSPV